MSSVIQIKRGAGTPGNKVLKDGELGFDTQGNKLYIGTNGDPIQLTGTLSPGGEVNSGFTNYYTDNGVQIVRKADYAAEARDATFANSSSTATTATYAQNLKVDKAIGSTAIPIYITEQGKPAECSVISIEKGGTGATTAEVARANLGINLTNLGINASAIELNRCAGLTDNVQTQLNTKMEMPIISSTSIISGITMRFGGIQICFGKCTLGHNWAALKFPNSFSENPNVILTPHTGTAGVITGKTRSTTTTQCEACIGGSGDGTAEFAWVAIGKAGTDEIATE